MSLGMVVALLLALVLFSSFLWITFGLISLALHLFMAGLMGALADAIVPGKQPWGWLGAILAGLVGSWIGVALIGQVGPSLFGVSLFPAFVGAMLLAAGAAVLGRVTGDRSRHAY